MEEFLIKKNEKILLSNFKTFSYSQSNRQMYKKINRQRNVYSQISPQSLSHSHDLLTLLSPRHFPHDKFPHHED